MATLTTTVRIIVDGLLADSVDIGTVQHAISFQPSNALTDGTGANQAKQAFTDTRTLAASATEDIDLSGALTNAFGTSLVFTKIKAMVISAAATNTNDVQVGGAASNGFINWVASATDIVNVKPGGIFVLTAPDANGLAVTAATGDILKITNSGGTTGVTYSIVLIGTV